MSERNMGMGHHALEQQRLTVAMATDENYIVHAATLIESIVEHTAPHMPCDFYILAQEQDITANSKTLLRQHVQDMSAGTCSIDFVDMSDYDFSEFHLNSYMSTATYYRFFIADIFPDVPYVLYLDCDMVTVGDLSGVVSEKFSTSGKAVAAVRDWYVAARMGKKFESYVVDELGLPVIDDYFNAGFILFNIKRCKELGIGSRLLELAAEIKQPTFQDQCLLNALFAAQQEVFYLDEGFNLSQGRIADIMHGGALWRAAARCADRVLSHPPLKSAVHEVPGGGALGYLPADRPKLIHYVGPDKPWGRHLWQRKLSDWPYLRYRRRVDRYLKQS